MANIPSPVVGVGGQRRPPWYEQLLLTLASQGPSVLMQWLEHRQQGQQQAAIDNAAGAALTGMLPMMSAQEAAMLGAAGMRTQGGGQLIPTVPSNVYGHGGTAATQQVPIAGTGGVPGRSVTAQTPGLQQGISTPTVRPMTATNQPNAASLAPGVAPELLKILQGQREDTRRQRQSDASVAASEASVRASDAAAADTTLATEHRRIMFPLQQETERARQRQATLAGDESEEALSFARSTRSWREQQERSRADMAAAQARLAEGQADEARELANKAARENKLWLNDRITADLQRSAALAADLLQMYGGIDQNYRLKDAQAEANLALFGTPKATRADLKTLYEQLQNDPNADLDAIVRERVMQTYGLKPEDASGLDNALRANGGSPAETLKWLERRGYTQEQLSQAVDYYRATLGIGAVRPEDIPDAARKAGLGRRLRESARRAQAMAASLEGGPAARAAVPPGNAGLGWAKVTDKQRQQMESGVIRGWAPPDRQR